MLLGRHDGCPRNKKGRCHHGKGEFCAWGHPSKSINRIMHPPLEMLYCISQRLGKNPDSPPRHSSPCPAGLLPGWFAFIFQMQTTTLRACALAVLLPGIPFPQIITRLCHLVIKVSAQMPSPQRALPRPTRINEALSPVTCSSTSSSEWPT